MKTKVLIVFLVIVLSLTSCASSKSEMPAYSMPQSSTSKNNYEYYGGEVAAVEEAVYAEDAGGANVAATDGERVVIKNASLEIVVDDPAVTLKYIGDIAESSGGFIVNSNLYKTTSGQGLEIPGAEITVRVPAEKLEDIIKMIEDSLEDPEQDVQYENVSGEDVTAEYTDLQSRLRNLEDAQVKLQAIMDEAYTTEDVLAVFEQLKSVNEQIEVLRGQIKYYDESARFSALRVSIIAREGLQEITIGKWQPKGVALEAIQTLVDALKFLAEAAIWIALFLLPVLLVIAIPVVLIILGIRALVKRRKAKKAAKQAQDNHPPAE